MYQDTWKVKVKFLRRRNYAVSNMTMIARVVLAVLAVLAMRGQWLILLATLVGKYVQLPNAVVSGNITTVCKTITECIVVQ